MKISELINILNDCKKKFGDINMYKAGYLYDIPLENTDISYDSNKRTLYMFP